MAMTPKTVAPTTRGAMTLKTGTIQPRAAAFTLPTPNGAQFAGVYTAAEQNEAQTREIISLAINNLTQRVTSIEGATAGGSGVSSVFGRIGAVVKVAGDYAVADVTGAAPLASPALTGAPSAPTAVAGTNTTQLATTAFVAAAVAAGAGENRTHVALGSHGAGTTTLDYSLGSSFSLTVSASQTIAVSNPPASGKLAHLTLEVTSPATSFVLTWPASFKSPGSPTTFTLSGASKRDLLVFATRDGGVTWFNHVINTNL
jgi:hypothetical protein